jgi:hypothetical protein
MIASKMPAWNPYSLRIPGREASAYILNQRRAKMGAIG